MTGLRSMSTARISMAGPRGQRPRVHVVISVALLLVSGGTAGATAGTVYVAGTGNDANDGSGWATAKLTVQAGLDAATTGDQVWVMAGTYVENITLKAGVELYGGFAGDETQLDQRGWTENVTVLDGNQAGPVVISPSGATASTRIDGFTIQNGKGLIIQNGKHLIVGSSQGAGICCSSSSPTVANCTIRDNNSEFGGGMSNLVGSAPVLTNCTFIANAATWSWGGGAMYNEQSNPVLTGCTFSGNTHEAMANSYSYPELTDCVFDGNELGMINGDSSPTLTRCHFTRNSASGMGNEELSSPVLTDCTFIGNSTSGCGGGIWNQMDCSPTLTNCTIADNSAAVGGGIWSITGGGPKLTHCTIRNNSAASGAGGGMYSGESVPTLTDCVFSGNSAQIGGGLYSCLASTVNMTKCTFVDNSASDAGGATLIGNACGTIISDCTFISNRATNQGGAIICYGCPTLVNCVFTRNSSPLGGAILVDNIGFLQHMSLVNCTILANSASAGGGGLYLLTDSVASLTNCIVWANTATTGAQIYGPATVSYSCVQDGWTGTGNITADPLLAAPVNDDLRLSAGSPCIDAGSNAAVPGGITTDLDGMPRLIDDPATLDTGSGTAPLVDMGAYEYQPPSTADFNEDGHVDGADLELFEHCVTGPAIAYAAGAFPTACTLQPDSDGVIAADFDADGDVDQTDFGVLQRCFSGEGPADSACTH